MNRNTNTSSITEAAMISGILVIIAYLSTFFSLVTFFYPLPAIILSKRRGLKYSVLSLVASGLIISMLLGLQSGLYYMILFSPLAIAFSYGICKDEEPDKTILMGSAAFMISSVVMIFLFKAISGIDVIGDMITAFNQSVDIYKGLVYKSSGSLDEAQINQLISQFENMGKMATEMISLQLPALLIISSVFTSAAYYFFVSKFGHRFRVDIRKHEGLSNFSFPRTFIIAMAVLLMVSFLLVVFNINVSVIQMNIFLICLMAMFLQGLAVMIFFLSKLNLSKIAKILIVMILMFSPGVLQLLAIVGIIDLMFNFRKIKIL